MVSNTHLISNKNNVIGVTETNITDPNFLGLHVEKFGTWVGGTISHGWSTCQSIISHLRFPIGLLLPTVRAIDNFVYMMTSSKCRPGTILENLYPPQNFVPVFLYTAVWSLESQFPWKKTDGASIQGNQKWRRLILPKKCAFEVELWHLNWARKGWHATGAPNEDVVQNHLT